MLIFLPGSHDLTCLFGILSTIFTLLQKTPPGFPLSPLYRPRSQGDNTFGHVRPSVRPSVWHVAVDIWARLAECSKSTMTHGIQYKISVCLSVIRKGSRSKAARSGRGLLIALTTHPIRNPGWKEVRTSSRPYHTSNRPLYTCIAPWGAEKVLGP